MDIETMTQATKIALRRVAEYLGVFREGGPDHHQPALRKSDRQTPTRRPEVARRMSRGHTVGTRRASKGHPMGVFK